MTTQNKFEMSEAPAEPTLGPAADTTSPKSVTTTEPTISAPKPTIYSPGDVRSTSAYHNNSRMTYLPQTFHAASSGRVGHPNTIATSQAITPHRNASLNPPTTPAENQTSSPKYDNSTRGPNPANSAESSGACSYCGLMGHSQDICRKQKRRVGCHKCGVKGHLAHQCGKASADQCLYCLNNGHQVTNCGLLQRAMAPCGYCSIPGHTEYQCYRKMRDTGFRTHRVRPRVRPRPTVPVVDNHIDRDLPRLVNRNPEVNVKSPASLEDHMLRWAHSKRVGTARSRSANDANRSYVASSARVENTQDPPALSKSDPQPVQNTNQTTGTGLPNIHDKPNDNKAGDRQSALGDMTMDGSSGQEPIDNDEEAHHHSSQNRHGEGPKHHMTVADPGLGLAVNEPIPKRTKTDKDAREFNASANTKDRYEPASIIRISYAPRDALRNKEVHDPGTTVSDDFTDFQRKLMKRRRGKAMRLRREQGRGHC